MKPSSARVLARLQEGPAMTADLCKPEVGGCRFGARVAELRSEGYDIHEERVRQGASRYVLISHPEVGAGSVLVSPSGSPPPGPHLGVTEPGPSEPASEQPPAPASSPRHPGALGEQRIAERRPDLTEGGAYEVRWIEPLPGMGWTRVARYMPGEPIRWFWRRERLAVAA